VDSPPRTIEIYLPDPLPILDGELASIEAHFAELIAAMLDTKIAEIEPA
jgi:hypothetical protein